MKISALILAVMLLTSCSRASEPNELAYIVAIGIDKGEEGQKYNVTLQIANPMAISGGSKEEGGEGGKKTISNISVGAPTIFSAVNIANHLYSKELSLAHTKLILFGEEIAKNEGLTEFSEAIARSEEIRPNTFLSVVKGEAKEYLNEIKPTNEVNPVQYYEVIYESDDNGFIANNPCQDFYAYEMSPERENVLPLSAVMKEGSGEGTQNNEYNGFEYRLNDYKAGEIKIEGDIKTQTVGMAVFKNGKMIEEAGAVETEIYNILTGNYIKSEITYYDKNDPNKPVALVQTQQRKPDIKVNISSDVPKIKIKLYLEADLRTVSQSYIVEQEMDSFEEQVTKEIEQSCIAFLEKTAREYKSDIVGFGRFIKHKFKSFDDFELYNWQDRYTLSEFEVDVDFHLRRSGLINRRRG
ncbi:MAG: Ger(x)C family spore germination protein [Eubacteriales bacterium]|nr:Ger(x)C family spore germination protein [Eubacteriales bacterium]